jgi:hypothetical protein
LLLWGVKAFVLLSPARKLGKRKSQAKKIKCWRGCSLNRQPALTFFLLRTWSQ